MSIMELYLGSTGIWMDKWDGWHGWMERTDGLDMYKRLH
jgi:hypothetical protein